MDDDAFKIMNSVFLGACALFTFLTLVTKNCCRAHDYNDNELRNQLSVIHHAILKIQPAEPPPQSLYMNIPNVY